QRATAMAERLEERGIAVGWRTIARRDTSRASKALAALARRPTLVGLYPPPRRGGTGGELAAAIAAHSYLAPQLDAIGAAARLVDFHNLEWRHLADLVRFAPRRRPPYARLQIWLMRRHEREVLRAADLATFASADELEWARRTRG